MGGNADPRKGAVLQLEALQRLRSQSPDLGFPIHYSGHLHDDLSLRLLYALPMCS